MAKDLRLPLPSDAQHPAHSQNIIMGRAADPWRAAETWIRGLASHCVPLHAKARLPAHPDLAHLAAEQALGIGMVGLAEAGRLSDKLLAWIARVVRCVTKVRDGFHCGLIEPSLTLHRLPPNCSPNRTARRDPRSGCMPVPSAAHPSRPRLQLDYGRSTTFTVSLEGIADTQAPGCL
jgi:hypothetical protein